jgi:restriction endonuclease Mrr
VLIDGDELAELLIAHDVGVCEGSKVTIKDLDEDFFTSEAVSLRRAIAPN